MSVSAIYILDVKGRVIISRDYRGDISQKCADKFIFKVNELEEQGKLVPIFQHEGISYAYVQHSDLYFMAVTRNNINAQSVVVFMHQLIKVFQYYFQQLEEESLRDNFVIVYELLDEVMDYGYPQYTEAKILHEYIKTDAYQMEVIVKPPMAVTNAVSWRQEGLFYKKNEVFLDVIENVNLTINTNGSIVRSEIQGSLKMRAYLSGMPECKLKLNDKLLFEAKHGGVSRSTKTVDLEDIKFHQCVRLNRFDNDRSISFIPPDGSFDLMSYRLSQDIKPLIWVEMQIEKRGRTRTEYLVKAKSQFKEQSQATGVEIFIPLPSDAIQPLVKATIGASQYQPEKDCIVWKIKNFPGGKEYLMRVKFSKPSVQAEDEIQGRLPPIRVKFEIPYFTVSGIQVRYLKVTEKSGYQALPWVRYITQSGDYEIRVG